MLPLGVLLLLLQQLPEEMVRKGWRWWMVWKRLRLLQARAEPGAEVMWEALGPAELAAAHGRLLEVLRGMMAVASSRADR